MTSGRRVLSAIEGSIWCIQPDKLREIAAVVANRMRGGTKLTASEVAAMTRAKTPAARRGAVAVLPLFGVIGQRMDMMTAISGGTSTEQFAKAFAELVADDNVSAIVIDIDSPGGSVAGVPELARQIHAARGTKPIVAVGNPLCASAALWIGSAADELVLTEMGMAGSRNAIMIRPDMTAKDEREGVAYHFITGGETDNKAFGNPHFPMSEEEQRQTQANVDVADNAFVEAIAQFRGMSAQKVRATYGEGLVFVGQRAVDAGIVDRIATLDDVVRELSGGAAPRRSGARAETTTHIDIAAGIDVTSEAFRASVADTIASITEARRDLRVRVVDDSVDDSVDTTEGESTTDAGGAAPEDHEPPASDTASAAEESTMPDNGTAATTAGAAHGNEAELLRRQELRGLAANGASQSQIDAWIDAGTSYDSAAAEMMRAARTATASAAPPARNGNGGVQVGATRADNDPRRGFASHRDYLLAVMKNRGVNAREHVKDERLRPLAVSGGDDDAANELAFILPAAFTPQSLRAAVGSDEQGAYDDRYGGFAVPKSTLPGILSVGFEGDPTAGRMQAVPMATPSVSINARTDKNHQTSVAGGLTVTRRPETVSATSSRMQTEMIELKATSLFGLAFATEELLQDSPISFAALIAAGFRDQFGAHILNEKIRGVGGSEYLGMLNSPCLVTVDKETNQTAATINFTNIVKMAARSWGFGSAMWLANHNTRPQLATIALPIGTGGVAMYQPSQQEGFPDMLWGRPVFYTEYCSSLGTAGDLILVNPTQYLEGIYQPLQSAESVHVRFVNHERAFKLWTRNAGAPWWRSALTPNKGAETLSPIVTLGARA